MTEQVSLSDIVDAITPSREQIYPQGVDPLNPETIVPGVSVTSQIHTAFQHVMGDNPKDWTPYIVALESVVQQFEGDLAFLNFWLQHVLNKAIREYLPAPNGSYPTYYSIKSSQTLGSLGSLSAVMSYLSGTSEVLVHFAHLFDPMSSPDRRHTNAMYYKNLVEDLNDFFTFPGMPRHLKAFLREYIFNVKQIAFHDSIVELEGMVESEEQDTDVSVPVL